MLDRLNDRVRVQQRQRHHDAQRDGQRRDEGEQRALHRGVEVHLLRLDLGADDRVDVDDVLLDGRRASWPCRAGGPRPWRCRRRRSARRPSTGRDSVT